MMDDEAESDDVFRGRADEVSNDSFGPESDLSSSDVIEQERESSIDSFEAGSERSICKDKEIEREPSVDSFEDGSGSEVKASEKESSLGSFEAGSSQSNFEDEEIEKESSLNLFDNESDLSRSFEDKQIEAIRGKATAPKKEPVEVVIGDTKCLLTDRVSYLNKNEIFTLISLRPDLVSSAPVTVFENCQQGSMIFLVDKSGFRVPQDVLVDPLRPWQTEEGGKKYAPKHSKEFVDGKQCKVIKATHPKCPYIKRQIFFFEDPSTRQLLSSVFFQYIFETEGLIVPSQNDSKHLKPLPSTVSAVTCALSNRTTRDARKKLARMGISVNRQTVSNVARNHETVVKTGSGPRVPTNLEAIGKRSITNPYLKVHTGSKINEKGQAEPETRIIETYPEAIRCFLAGLPDKKKIDEHRKLIEKLDGCTKEESSDLIDDWISRRTVSQHFPEMGSHVQCDSTFDVCHMNVTFFIGVTDKFVNKVSGKNASMVLATMLHSQREKADHQHFAQELGKQMRKIDPTKKVPMYLTDGEKALQAVLEEDAFSEAVSLGCDLHRRDNMETSLGKKRGKKLAKYLFGIKTEVDGDTVLSPGLLGALTQQQFDQQLEKLRENHPNLYTWARSRQQDLWERHSLRQKLRGGFLGQYLTTNIIEGFNMEYKRHAKTPYRPGEDVLDVVKTIHEDQILQFKLAVVGGSQTVRLSPEKAQLFRLEQEWDSLSGAARKLHLEGLGLIYRDVELDRVLTVLPAWCFDGMSSEYKEKLIRCALSLEVHRLPDFFVVKKKTDDERLLALRTSPSGLPVCPSSQCTEKSQKYIVCHHVVSVMIFVSPEERLQMIRGLRIAKDGTSIKQILGSTIKTSDGSKRKGGSQSKGNKARTLSSLSSQSVIEKENAEKEAVRPSPATSPAAILLGDTAMHSPPCKRVKQNNRSTDVPHVRSRRGRAVNRKIKFTPGKK